MKRGQGTVPESPQLLLLVSRGRLQGALLPAPSPLPAVCRDFRGSGAAPLARRPPPTGPGRCRGAQASPARRQAVRAAPRPGWRAGKRWLLPGIFSQELLVLDGLWLVSRGWWSRLLGLHAGLFAAEALLGDPAWDFRPKSSTRGLYLGGGGERGEHLIQFLQRGLWCEPLT